MRWMNLAILVLTLNWISSCANVLTSQLSSSPSTVSNSPIAAPPEIPINIDDAFLPLRRDEEGKILPSYQWDVCEKKVLFVCTKMGHKRVYMRDLEWFLANGWGLSKRKRPQK